MKSRPRATTDVCMSLSEWIGSNRMAVCIKNNNATPHKVDLRVFFQIIHLDFETLWVSNIIPVHAGKILSPTQVNRLIQACRKP